MKTKDNKSVNIGDEVFVIGSLGVHKATVLEPVTNYVLFNNIPVSNSFSTEQAANEFRNKNRK